MIIKQSLSLIMLVFITALISCNTKPKSIILGKDACSFCKMSVADNRFGAEILTTKGKIFIFDDMHCLLKFRESGAIDNNDIKETYFVNFEEPHNLIETSNVLFMKSADLRSPMGGNIAAFDDSIKLNLAKQKFSGEDVNWEALIQK